MSRLKALECESSLNRIRLSDKCLIKIQGNFWKYNGQITHTKNIEKPIIFLIKFPKKNWSLAS